MLSNLLEVVETPITRRSVEGYPECVAVTLLKVEIYVFRDFFNFELSLLFEPRFELAFKAKCVQFIVRFHDFFFLVFFKIF